MKQRDRRDDAAPLPCPGLLTALQEGVPIDSRPFACVGREFDRTESDVLEQIRAWFASGVARRFGAVFDSRSLGYRGTLCAADIPAGDLEAVAARLTPHPGITHCYEREGRPNLWFTLTAPAEAMQSEVERAAHAVAPHELLNLPAVRKFKIEAIFGADSGSGRRRRVRSGERVEKGNAVGRLSARERRVVRCLQGNLPLVNDPFGAVAREVGYDPAELLELLARWRECGVIRRVALVVRHREVGYTSNSMCVWPVREDRIEKAGCALAAHMEVSHCYERPASPLFPYNLYAMIHAGSPEQAREIFERLSAEAGLENGRMMFSLREFKKTSPVFFEGSE